MLFREVIGHAGALARLRGHLAAGRLPHALLFAGPRGVGKRTVAEALAAAYLCPAARDEACGSCPSCRRFKSGNHPDHHLVARLPGKRDIGIGQIRTLLEALHLKSHSGAGRTALVDGAERMTVEAQNAFLKTLEEPPPATVIVLVTAIPERILPTVRSRAQLVRFTSLGDAELARFQARAASPRELVLPLALAMGAPGRLHELAGRPLAAGRDLFFAFLEAPAAGSPFELAAGLAACAAAQAASTADGAADDGGAEAPQEEGDEDSRERTRDSLRALLKLFSFALRDAAVSASAPPGARLFHEDRAAGLARLAARHDAERWLSAQDVVEKTARGLARNFDPRLLLEGMGAELKSLLS